MTGDDPASAGCDPLTDLIRTFRAASDNTAYRPELRISPRLRFSTETPVTDDELGPVETYRTVIDAIVQDAIFRQLQEVAAAAETARKAGCRLCVHEPPTADILRAEDLWMEDRFTVRVRQRAHLLWPGQTCADAVSGPDGPGHGGPAA